MASYFIEAPVVKETINGRLVMRPDVPFEVEGAALVLHIAKGTPDEVAWWHINGRAVTKANTDIEKGKGREVFETGKPDLTDPIQKAIDSHHRFAGETPRVAP